MPAAGPRLRSEREKRGLRLVDVAMATKVGAHHLSALEYEDFDALPDDRSVMRFVRVYAEHIGMDPEATAAEYARELEAARPAGTETRPAEEAAPEEDGGGAENAAAVETEEEAAHEESAQPVEEAAPLSPREPSPGGPRFRTRIVLAAAALIVALALLGWWWLAGEAREEPPTPPAEPGPGGSEATPEAIDSPPVEAAPENGKPLAPGVNPEEVRLTVSEHGVGSGIVERGLVGEGSRFVEGERVWFWTRVNGGVAGETIRHVWIHEGRETADIPLTLGGPHWRTQSRKILTPGLTGRWAVEARDSSGRVLARGEFVCEPR